MQPLTWLFKNWKKELKRLKKTYPVLIELNKEKQHNSLNNNTAISMKIENQVCTREQGEKLKAFGLLQTNHRFSWVWDTLNSRYDISGLCVEALGLISSAHGKTNIAVPAFTVAELGVMIDGAFITAMNHLGKWEAWANPNNNNLSDDDYDLPLHGTYNTEAECRAGNLIDFINNGHLSVDKINERLIIN